MVQHNKDLATKITQETLTEVIVKGFRVTQTYLDKKINDMLWRSTKANSYGNTGRYNKSGRTSDQYFYDEFLKWYYNDDNKKK
jgi:hypothetical protein